MYYLDYYWEKLIPKGIYPTKKENAKYKIVVDPYRRFFVVERRVAGEFEEIIYDSSLLDARQFHERELLSWEQLPWKESSETSLFLYVRRDEKIAMIEKRPRKGDGATIFCSASGVDVFYQTQQIVLKEGREELEITLFDREHKMVLQRSFSIRHDQIQPSLLKDCFGITTRE